MPILRILNFPQLAWDPRYIARGGQNRKNIFLTIPPLLFKYYFREKLFTKSLPSDEYLLWFRYSGFQVLRHTIHIIPKNFICRKGSLQIFPEYVGLVQTKIYQIQQRMKERQFRYLALIKILFADAMHLGLRCITLLGSNITHSYARGWLYTTNNYESRVTMMHQLSSMDKNISYRLHAIILYSFFIKIIKAACSTTVWSCAMTFRL
jgi:hypothetical protein